MALMIYRRHSKACSKDYEQNFRIFFPATPKAVKADCQCPIVCSGSVYSSATGVTEKFRHLSLDTNDWDEAKSKLKKLENLEPQSNRVTVETATERYLDYKGEKGQNIDAATLRKHVVMLNDRIKPFCVENDIELLSAFDKADIVTQCFLSFKNLNPNHNKQSDTVIEKPLSDRTKEKELDRFRSFLRFCVEQGWLEKNHAANIKLGVSKPSPKYGLEPHEEQQMFDAIDLVSLRRQMDQYNSKELRALVLVMRFSGLRISDAVMLDHTQLVSRESGNGYAIKIMGQQKTGEWVRIPITLETAQALQALNFKGDQGGKRYWFYTGDGKQSTAITNWRERVDNLLKLAQEPPQKPFAHHATPHTLRHTFAISALNAGADIKMVSRWLGHSSTKITEAHYSHAIRATHIPSEAAYDAMIAATKKPTLKLVKGNRRTA
jgi:integrase